MRGEVSEAAEKLARSQLVRELAVANLTGLKAAEFTDGLRAALDTGQVLLVLDGLDEVPHQLRSSFRRTVGAAISELRPARVIVTCRIRSYREDDRLEGFAEHTIAPFTEEQITRFVTGWYAAREHYGLVNAQQARDKADDLTRAALGADLNPLASNPMLLTTMALIHQQNITLPKQRVQLYKLAVDVLIRRWQKAKSGVLVALRDDPDQALAKFLDDTPRLRAALEELAFVGQQAGQGKTEADIPSGTALNILRQPEHLGNAGLAEAFLNYVDQGAGLLIGRGGSVTQPPQYGFPHRTFQEYLAGCHHLRARNARSVARGFRERAGEGDYWTLAVRLAFEELRFNDERGESQLLDLAYALCASAASPAAQHQRADLWSANIAALLGADVIARDTAEPDGGTAYLERLIPRLVAILTGGLTAAERAEAGGILATLGDPRPGVGLLPAGPGKGLPDLLWVSIPGAEARAKKGANAAPSGNLPYLELAVEPFSISRYPVTVAQYAAFVQAGGYEDETWWRGAGRDWLRKQRVEWRKQKQTPGPVDYNPVFQTLNHPRVGVTWHEATAFCAWLSARLYPELATAAEPPVRLPAEAEWERAARGLAGREYPWGDEDKDLAGCCNMGGTGLGHTSPVGMFPRGDTPPEAVGAAGGPGLADLAGNVWEWCATPYVREFRDAADYRNKVLQLEKGGADEGARVLRGGSWRDVDSDFLLSSYRSHDTAVSRDLDLGFSLCVGWGVVAVGGSA